MPKITAPRELFLHELGDALTFEKTIVKMLPKLQREAKDRTLANGFQKHLEQSKTHVKNLEKAFKALGARPTSERCPGIEGIKAEHDQFMRSRPTPDIVDSFLTTAAARTEHYEIAAYEGLIDMARAMGEREVVGLLEQNLKQDKETLKQVQTVGKRLAREAGKKHKETTKQETTGRGGTRTSGGRRGQGRGRTTASGRSRTTKSGGATRSTSGRRRTGTRRSSS